MRSCYVLSKEPARLGTRGACGRGRCDDCGRAFGPLRYANWLSVRLLRRGYRLDRIFRVLPDVCHGRPKAFFAMMALARTGRCPPELIDAARCGDEKPLLSLISAAQPDVRRYAARNGGGARIDEAVQETLLLLYRRIGTLRAVTSFSAWLFAVARRARHRLLRLSIRLPHDPLHAAEAL